MRAAEPATRGFLRVKGSEYLRDECGSRIFLAGWCGFAQLSCKRITLRGI